MCGVAEKLLVKEDAGLYNFINQGCLTVDNMDDKFEMKCTDVCKTVWQTFVNFVVSWTMFCLDRGFIDDPLDKSSCSFRPALEFPKLPDPQKAFKSSFIK